MSLSGVSIHPDNQEPSPLTASPSHSPSHQLFCPQSTSHRCFSLNFSVVTESQEKKDNLLEKTRTSVVIFLTQKKKWHVPTSHFCSLLKNTSAPQLNLSPGQMQEIMVNQVRFLLLCVGTDVQGPSSLPMDTLLHNLRKCVDVSSKNLDHNIYYDGNSFLSTYQCLQQNLIQAISIIALFQPAHHCLVFNFDAKFKFSFEQRSLSLHIPLFYNGTRQQLLSVSIPDLPQYTAACKSVRSQISAEIHKILLPLKAGHSRKCAILTSDGQCINIADFSKPLNLASIAHILVKDSQTIKCFSGKNSRYITDIDLLQNPSSSIYDVIFRKVKKKYNSFSVKLNSPLKSELFPGLSSIKQGPSSPIFNSKIMLVENLKELCDQYPEIDKISVFFGLSRWEGQSSESSARSSANLVTLAQDVANPLSHFLGEFTSLFVSQSSNPQIQDLIRKVKNSPNQQFQHKDVNFKIFEEILYGSSQMPGSKTGYLPVLPDDKIVPLALKIHSQGCVPPRRIIKKIKQAFCHVYNITSHISLERVTQALFPCYKCLSLKPAFMSAALNMQYKSIGLQALGKKICTMAALDVFYLADPASRVFTNNFVSIIICFSCRFLHLKPIPSITSHALAQHLLEYVRLTGRIPAVIVSDAATTNLFAQMQNLLKDFNMIHILANKDILKQNNENNEKDRNRNENENNSENKNESSENKNQPQPQLSYLSTPIQLLTKDQKSFLLQDISRSDPPLFPPTLRHLPVSYKASQMDKSTSLGILDNVCRRLQIFLKKSAVCINNPKSFQNQISSLISIFEYNHNFCLESAATSLIPASVHLGTVRATNIIHLTDNIANLPNPQSQSLKNMQELLLHARKILDASTNTLVQSRNQQDRQLRIHGRLKHPGDILSQIQPFDVLFVKTELQNRPKMDFFVSFHGPCLVLGVQKKSEHLILFALISGEILIKSYKQIRFAFSKEVFNLPLFPHIGKEVQFRLFSATSKVFEKDNAANIISTTTKMIYNLHRLFLFLSPLLPNQTETQNHLKILLPFLDNDAHGHDDDDDLNPDDSFGDHDDDGRPDGSTKLQPLHSKPSVSFDNDVKQDNQHYPPLSQQQHNDNDNGQIDDANHGDDRDNGRDGDGDGDNPRPHLHANAPSEGDQPPISTSAEFQSPAQNEPILSRAKYNLRRNPPRNRKYFQ